MAEIIDFSMKMRDKFYAWCSQYVSTYEGEDISRYQIESLIVFLITNNVFTFDDLRAELNEHKISLHQRYFDRAKKVIEGADNEKKEEKT